ncbi:helix-turn-helix domain-containing protein [Clostridium sp. 19966]|uniref:helix-turn-helix domain-containing protein n=1 Tax=Clostridium sp. 19966 TaxID=2768166 RepID=UPI0028DF9C53|nr:helix-turn-helix transcriptional regulator [Clostridium sp. 19966]MDT8716747.1 helix-turn-helix domain-containing protein [Clostridium sp. 19966]
MSRVGEKIKEIRERAGLSQKAFGKKLGVAESFINDVELGRKVVNESFINRVSKLFKSDINDISMSEAADDKEEKTFIPSTTSFKKKEVSPKAEINDAWSGAFGSVLKGVSIYSYDMKNVIGTKLMPIQNNKIEGHGQDKVFYIKIEDEDMSGFRILNGDLAFAYSINEVENNAICLVEYKGERKIRQIKKLDSNKLLLISNHGSVRTETMPIKEVKAIARIKRIEFEI